MDTFIYNVMQLSTHEDCKQYGYKQGFIATDPENQKLLASVDVSKGYIIQDRMVRATTPTAAIMKFKKWLNEGKDDEFLMSF